MQWNMQVLSPLHRAVQAERLSQLQEAWADALEGFIATVMAVASRAKASNFILILPSNC